MKNTMTFFLFVFSMSFCLGCGGGDSDAPATVNVTGTITFDSEPVNEASIIFEDANGKDKSYFAKSVDGKFSTEMTPGKKKIVITAIREIPGKTELGADGTTKVPATEQFIPEKYNSATTLEEEIKPEEKNEIIFDLKSK